MTDLQKLDDLDNIVNAYKTKGEKEGPGKLLKVGAAFVLGGAFFQTNTPEFFGSALMVCSFLLDGNHDRKAYQRALLDYQLNGSYTQSRD